MALSRPLTNRLAAAAAAVVTTGAFVGLTPAGAQAAETGTVQGTSLAAVMAEEFQCGPNNWIGYLVPDNPPGAADFGPACASHDQCYSPGSPYNRSTCDSWFRDDMRFACAEAGAGSFCLSVASLYYGAVRTFGGSFYGGDGLNN